MNKIKIDNYYKPESKTLRIDEVDYTIIPNSDINTLLDKLQQENQELKKQLEEYKNPIKYFKYANKNVTEENKILKEVIDKVIEYINKYESIKAYYEYIDEDGYDEYNYDEDFKKELLDILKEVE